MKQTVGWLGLLLCVGFAGHASAAPIQEVASKGGIKAWLVEDHHLPLIAMDFAFHGGVEQDPWDKQGLATISMELMTEGAGAYDAEMFQQALADHSIQMKFAAGRDHLKGSIKALRQDRGEAFKLLALALTQPRIDAKDFARAKGEQMTALKSQFGNPTWQARYGLFHKIFGDHPYGERSLGTLQTLENLSEDDVRKFLAGHIAKDNLVVAVAGDVTPNELADELDQIFGNLPGHAGLTPIPDAEWRTDGDIVLVPREGTQTELLFALPGPKRHDPDWYATEIANYILGGGGFSSRLMHDVRDKKGLTYGIDTDVAPSDHAGLIIGNAATDNPKTKEAWDITLATMRHFYEDGATPDEIAAAKDYLTGSMPLSLTSTDRIAGMMVKWQLEHQDINYLGQRNDLIRAVTADDVQSAIRHWFNPDHMTVSMVGKPDNIVPTETRTLVRE